ncbi:hypothetical protein B0H14DRAFT_3511986 [Mycena olivaceomarginata]|nr:hypothetical protein B0H14DRAFT_3511986 [Mycena olivaceomarginata]
MATTRSKWSARQDRSDRRSIRQEATAPARRTRKAPTPGRMKQAAGSTLPGTNPGHSGQPTPDGSPTTDIQWEEWEVGGHLDLGDVNEISLHFLNKRPNSGRPRSAEEQKPTPDPSPLSASPKLCMAALKNSFGLNPRSEERAVSQPLACADAEGATDDGLSDADAEGEADDDEIDHSRGT